MRAYHFLIVRHALDDIAKRRLKISLYDDLNDPFELYAAELSDQRLRLAYRKFKETTTKRCGLLCFSKSWGSPLLWSHYGDRHRGAALEIELSGDHANEMSYEPARLALDIRRKLSSGGLGKADLDRIWRTKIKQWKCAEEVRMFLSLDDPPDAYGLHFCNLGGPVDLKGVILGPLCTASVADIARVLPKGQSLRLRKSRLAFKTFSVVGNKAFGEKTVNRMA
jgi:hypothetical protein